MVAEDSTNACADLAAKTLLQLTEKLYEAARRPRNYRDRRDPHLMRARVWSNLESALAQRQLRRIEAIESFLQLCQPDAPGLKRILRREAGEFRGLVVQTFRTSRRPGVLHLLLDLLEGPHTPSALAGIVCEREDRAFLCALFARAADGPSSSLARNPCRNGANRLFRFDDLYFYSANRRGRSSGNCTVCLVRPTNWCAIEASVE
jgi:hypothetical protein